MNFPAFWTPCLAFLAAFVGLSAAAPARADVALSSGWTLEDVAKVADAPDVISKVGYAPGRWHKAVVPGTVLTALVAEGVYPDPMYGENNRPDIIPESLCRTSYWYRTETAVPADYAGKRIWLNFDGINYTADVWVNGRHAGTIAGAFARGIFDITDLVQAGQKTAIAVKINPPPHPGNPQEQTVANGAGFNGGDLMQDGPTFGCTVGWDWIPAIRDRNVGIWQNVSLSATGPVRIDNPAVSSDLPLPKTDSADLTLVSTLRNATDKSVSGTLRGSFAGGEFAVPVTLGPRENKDISVTPRDAAPLHLNNPRLWWPNTYGQPNLYKMRVSFDVAGTPSDARDVTFGVRKITYQVPAAQSLIPATDNLTVFVNGVPVICKGGCWGMDDAMKKIPADVLDAKVRFHKEANYTMIRNWVGQSTSEDFYNACDKYGILVWDEFFQANRSDGPQVGGYPRPDDTPEVLAWRQRTIDMYLANVREKILRFRGHPSIALWCGRNESDPEPAAIAAGVQKLAAELDPARFYQANSDDGRGVRSGGPYSWRVPSAYYGPSVFGNAGGGLLALNRFEPFKTELGSVSIPTLEFIKTWLPEKDWADVNDAWAAHDLCRGAQNGNTFALGIAMRYGAIAPRDLPDFCRKSQMAVYESYRAMYEGRMARLFDPCAGILTWMSNPSQPSFVWQIYSYDLEPLAALFAARKACEPLHIQLNQNDFHVTVINTAPVAQTGLNARIRIYNMDGALKSDQTRPLAAKPCAATDVLAVDWPADLSPVHFVKLQLTDSAGTPLSDNFYWRSSARIPATLDGNKIFGAAGLGNAARGGGFPGSPVGVNGEDLSALQSMPTAHLDVTLRRHDAVAQDAGGGGTCLIDATLTNPGKTPALLAHLQLRNARTRLRILPAFYSDNYLSLLPGESKTITIQAPAAQLGADAPLITVDGWNVSVAPKTFPEAGGVTLAPNADALVSPKP